MTDPIQRRTTLVYATLTGIEKIVFLKNLQTLFLKPFGVKTEKTNLSENWNVTNLGQIQTIVKANEMYRE